MVLAMFHLSGQEQADPASVERGNGEYTSNCAFCHGNQGAGTPQAPNLLRSLMVRQDRSGEVLIPFLKEGRPATGMPSFTSLSQSQLTDIISFLKARSLAAQVTEPQTALLVGDAKAGQAYFNGAGACKTCHSPSGDLASIGTRYQPLPMITAFLTPKAQPIAVTATLSSGETFSGKLTFLNEFVVEILDAAGNHHSWPRDALKSLDVRDPLAAHKAQLIRYTDDDIHNVLAYLVTLK
jgi:cytochrome c oxidase cbb3-type subunit III